MKRIDKTHLSIALLLVIVLLIPLVKQYSNFIFHTYETRVYTKEIYMSRTDEAVMDYYSVIENEDGFQLGKAKIEIKNHDFISEGDEIEIDTIIDDRTFKHVLQKEDLYHYNLDLITDRHLDDVNNIDVVIHNLTSEKVISLPLVKENLSVYGGQNKEFSVKELYVYKNRIHFGSINCENLNKWLEDYDEVSLEYRYRKADADSNNPYAVFYKTEGKLEDVFNHYSLSIEDIEMPEGLYLQDLDLSLVVILKGEEDLAFSIQLNQVSEVE